jgi:hypothetical protein
VSFEEYNSILGLERIKELEERYLRSDTP